jgi:flagellar motor protein MotB
MRTFAFTSTVLLVSFHWHAVAQSPPASEGRRGQPLYQVTIVSRTTKAINYGYLTAPTRIDFHGTPVIADARGEAVVEPKRGATLLKMRFDHVPPPSRFGPQYLTYVVWAISPDGRAQNMGELTLDGSDKGKLSASTPMQTFAMIVTAEPYYSVTQPSDVVVMENVVGPGTIGKVEEVNATYELLPRKPFTYEAGSQPKASSAPVSQEQYEAISALYQALNAIQIAQAQDADRYAPERLARAREVYNQARNYPANLSKEIVSMAREATQIAEDSRAIAVRRAEAEKLADEQRRLNVAPQATPTEPTAYMPRSTSTQSQAESGRARAKAPEASVTLPPQSETAAENPPAIQADHSRLLRDDPQAPENRRRLLSALPQTYAVVDSGRGVVVTIPEQLAGTASLPSYLAPLAAAMRPYKDLHIEVGGHTDVDNAVAATEREAEKVRLALIGAGISPDILAVRGYGNTVPRASNASAAGRVQNRRVEIVIAGDSIGILPTWGHTYSLQPQTRR